MCCISRKKKDDYPVIHFLL